MVLITANRQRQCKATLGGIKAVYLAPYRKLQRSEIVYDGVSLLEFPEMFFYKFTLAGGVAFIQQQQQNEGGKYYELSLSLTFNRITAFDNMQFQKLLKKDYFLVVQDGSDNHFLAGFRNGVTADSLKTSSTQYAIEFTGQEEELAPFVNEIMEDAIKPVEGVNYIFQDGRDFIFQDDKNYIFQ
jgi:hypothetical protein